MFASRAASPKSAMLPPAGAKAARRPKDSLVDRQSPSRVQQSGENDKQVPLTGPDLERKQPAAEASERLTARAVGFSAIQMFSSEEERGVAERGSFAPRVRRRAKFEQSGDSEEREADTRADEVMRMDTPPLEPAISQAGHAGGVRPQQLTPRLTATLVNPMLPPQAAAAEAPASVRRTLHLPGEPLSTSTRAFFEPRFGFDFSAVRIHTDTRAAASADAIDARAYAAGSHVVFGPGMYDPATQAGRRLLAHELAHVVQQTGSPSGGPRSIARDPKTPPFKITQQDMVYLQKTMERFYRALGPKALASLERNTTVVIALVTYENEPHLVYTVAGNSTNPQIRKAADALGITRWDPEGISKIAGEHHAEQLTFEAASKLGFKVKGMAVSREPCADCGPVVAAKGVPIVYVRIPGSEAGKGPAGAAGSGTGIDENDESPSAGRRRISIAPPGAGEAEEDLPSGRGRVSISGALVGLAEGALQIWLVHNLEKENEQKLKADQAQIDKQIRKFMDDNSEAIADRWIDFQPVYVTFTTSLSKEEQTFMPMSVAPGGQMQGQMTPSGPPQTYTRYLGSQLLDAKVNDHSVDDHRITTAKKESDAPGPPITSVTEIETRSTFLPPDNDAMRARIEQRIADIDRELNRAPYAPGNFSLEIARDQLRQRLALLQF